MANFQIAIKKLLANEGGYVNDPDDPGGETYKGVARKMHPTWEGWQMVDQLKSLKDFPECMERSDVLQESILSFYRVNFWNPIQADYMNQEQAECIFDFGVNAGLRTSVKLAQMAIGADPDGIIGKQTLDLLAQTDSKAFLNAFTVLKIARYIDIVRKKKTSMKYFYGWVLRAIKAVNN